MKKLLAFLFCLLTTGAFAQSNGTCNVTWNMQDFATEPQGISMFTLQPFPYTNTVATNGTNILFPTSTVSVIGPGGSTTIKNVVCGFAYKASFFSTDIDGNQKKQVVINYFPTNISGSNVNAVYYLNYIAPAQFDFIPSLLGPSVTTNYTGPLITSYTVSAVAGSNAVTYDNFGNVLLQGALTVNGDQTNEHDLTVGGWLNSGVTTNYSLNSLNGITTQGSIHLTGTYGQSVTGGLANFNQLIVTNQLSFGAGGTIISGLNNPTIEPDIGVIQDYTWKDLAGNTIIDQNDNLTNIVRITAQSIYSTNTNGLYGRIDTNGNIFSTTSITTGPAGVFGGNGANLTNVPSSGINNSGTNSIALPNAANTFTGTFSGNGNRLTNTPQNASYAPQMYSTPVSMSGVNSQYQWGTWGTGTNQDDWLTNAIIQMNLTGYNQYYPVMFLGDGTWQSRNGSGNLVMASCFAHTLSWYSAFAHTNNVKLFGYLSVSGLSAGGNPGGGSTNMYQDVQFVMSNGLDGIFLAQDAHNAGDAAPTNYLNVLGILNQAVDDFNYSASLNSSNQYMQAFGVTASGISGTNFTVNTGWYTGINRQLFYSVSGLQPSLGTSGGPSPATMTGYLSALMPYIQNPWLNNTGHFLQPFSINGAVDSGTGAQTNLFNLSIVMGMATLNCFGQNGDPHFNNGQFTSIWLPSLAHYYCNSNVTALMQDGRIYGATLTYSNGNNFILESPFGSAYSATRIICLINTNSTSQVITCNVTNFYGTSNQNYSLFEPFSTGYVSNFQNSFTFSVGSNSCNILKVQPGTVPTTMTTGNSLIIGQSAAPNYSGVRSVIEGYQAAYGFPAGAYNDDIFIGYQTGYQDAGANNVWIGSSISGSPGTSAQGCVFIGSTAANGVAGSCGNDTVIGDACGRALTNASGDIVIGGYNVAAGLTSGGSNIVIGTINTTPSLSTGANNIIIETAATANAITSGTNNVQIGAFGGPVNENNTVRIGDSATVSNYLFGIITGNGAGLTNTFNGSTNASIVGSTSGVTNTSTKYGTCVVVSTAGTYSNFDSGGNWLFTNASVTGEETWQVGPGAGVKSITAGITSCKIIFQ